MRVEASGQQRQAKREERTMELLDKLKEVKSQVEVTQSDYETLVILANFLAELANDPLIGSPEAAQLLKEIGISSMKNSSRLFRDVSSSASLPDARVPITPERQPNHAESSEGAWWLPEVSN
jgi:hypothetical protein